MPEEKNLFNLNNRSVRRTKTALRNSLIELMKTRSILHISVKEICNTADVGRSTFYAHYKDQYSLLRQMEEETLAWFEDMLNKYRNKNSKKDIAKMLEEMLAYVAENGDAIQVLLSENGDIDYQKKLFFHFVMHNQVKKYISANQENEEINAYTVFLVHGAIGLIQYWLKEAMNIPVPKLAGMIMKWTEQQVNFKNFPS